MVYFVQKIFLLTISKEIFTEDGFDICLFLCFLAGSDENTENKKNKYDDK